ncbi:hypothetical protein [Rossellomorea aquimaris]|jgi:hypothetical protein|uniref:Uncharacterized protein n=1 Tax=Rossellomorea aquimaris TaxID=189382 RepID=A0A1J6VWT0_9BACI|nr:hypothetical protein [Rossellomorea aquimaris]OIU69717.1 hypothetical protein BHE18_02015 [Rossellomorea aquimaris]
MRNSVIGRKEKIKSGSVSGRTVLLSMSEGKGKAAEEADHVFIPVELAEEYKGKNAKVYFDLELYPFFQRMKEVIGGNGDHRGVLRLRRTLPESGGDTDICGDLFVLSGIAGEAGRIHVTAANRGKIPRHVILTLSFAEGKMAHLEYTFGGTDERIELEWSGIRTIAEFDSEEMTPVKSNGSTRLPLQYSVEDILEKSRIADEAFYEKLDTYKTLVKGGGA